MEYNVRIDDNFLRGDHVDGEVLEHSDLNELENVAKTAINANYEDIQKLQDGTILIGNSEKLGGASLSKFADENLQNSDTKVPTSSQVKQYVDGAISNIDLDGYYTKREVDDTLGELYGELELAFNDIHIDFNQLASSIIYPLDWLVEGDNPGPNENNLNELFVGSYLIPDPRATGGQIVTYSCLIGDQRILLYGGALIFKSSWADDLLHNYYTIINDGKIKLYTVKTIGGNILESIDTLTTKNYVDGLITNYYTKTQSDSLLDTKEDKSNKVTSISGSSTDTQYPSAKSVYTAINNIGIDNYYNKSQTDTLLAAKQNISNLVTSISNSSTDTQYPSAKSVYDSQVSQNTEIEALRSENNYLNSIIDQIVPKVTGSGEYITLNDTIEAKMDIDLYAKLLSQFTTTGKNLLPFPPSNLRDVNIGGTWNGNVYTWNGITFTINDDYSIKINGTSTDNAYLNLYNSSSVNVVTDTSKTYTYSKGADNSNIVLALYEYISSWQTIKYVTSETTTYTPSGNQTGQLFRLLIESGKTLNNVTVYPMLVEGTTVGDYEPYTNGASPNPQYPQDIHTISGSNKVVVCGKNVFNYEQFKEDNSTKTSGTPSEFYFASNGVECKYNNFFPNTAYNISGTWTSTKSNGQLKIVYTDSTELIIFADYSSSTSASGTFDISTDGTKTIDYLRFMTWSSANYTLKNFQIERGTSKTSFEPYTSQEANIDLGELEYCKIGDYEDEFKQSTGKNKLPNNATSQTINNVTFTIEDGGVIKLSGTANANSDLYLVGDANNYVDLGLPAGTYTLSGCSDGSLATYMLYAVQNRNGNLSYYQNITGGTNISIQSGDTFRIFVRVISGQNVGGKKIFPMLESGLTASEYEPYLPIGSWYLKKNIGKVVLDGNSTISVDNTNQRVVYSGISSLIVVPASEGTVLTGLCNNLEVKSFTSVYNQKQQGIASSSSGNLSIHVNGITDTGSLTEAQFQTWLSTNNIILYYLLETPTYTPITGTLATQLDNIKSKLLSQKGQTNISQVNNDLPFEINVSAFKELS